MRGQKESDGEGEKVVGWDISDLLRSSEQNNSAWSRVLSLRELTAIHALTSLSDRCKDMTIQLTFLPAIPR